MSTSEITAPNWRRTIPAEMLYWAWVPPSQSTTAQADRYAAERLLPVDCDQLHLVMNAAPGGGRLIAAIEPERLRRFLLDVDASAGAPWELVPDRAPPGLPADAVALIGTINLLTGSFEPAPRRTFRHRCLGIAAVGIAVSLLLLVIGTARNAAWSRAEAARLRSEAGQRLAAALPSAPGDAVTPDERLTMELRRLDAAAALPSGTRIDVPHATQLLLAAIPADLRVQVENLSLASDRVTARVRVPDLASAERLQQAWSAVAPAAHLRPEPLQAQRQEGVAVATLAFAVEGGAP